MSENKTKRFEDWEEVDCNDCERWWLNQCDGAKTLGNRSNLACTSFLPTRNVLIPELIKKLQKRLFWTCVLNAINLVLAIGLLIVIIWR